MPSKTTQIPQEYKGRNIYSISKLGTFQECEYQFYLNYLVKNRGQANIYSLLGTETHDILEKCENNELEPKDALNNFEVALFNIMNIQNYQFMSEKVKNNYNNSVRHYFKTYEKIDCKKLLTEKDFFTEIEGCVMRGFIDAIQLNEDGTVEIIDYKTSSEFDKKKLAVAGRQLVLYAMAIEKEFQGIKIAKVKWDMLKYCWVTWEGATKPRTRFILRNNLVLKMKTELRKDLLKAMENEAEVDLLLSNAIEQNDIDLLPKDIVNKYTITKGYVEFPYTEETKEELKYYIKNSVDKIEYKLKETMDKAEEMLYNNRGYKGIDIFPLYIQKLKNDDRFKSYFELDSTGKTQEELKSNILILLNEIEKLWKPKDIEENNFFCNTLCDHKKACKHYRAYNANKENNSYKVENTVKILENQEDLSKKAELDIMKNLFG